MNITNRINIRDVNRAKGRDGPFIKINNERELDKYVEYSKEKFNIEKYSIFEDKWNNRNMFLDYSNFNINSFPIYVRFSWGFFSSVNIVKTKPNDSAILNIKKLY